MQPILEEYKNYMLHVKQLSDGTVRGYVSDMKLFFEYHRNYETATRPILLAYIARLSETASPATIMKKISALQSFWGFLVDSELVTKDITSTLPRPRMKSKIVTAPSTDFVNELIEKMEKQDNGMLAMAIRLGAHVGLRAEEAIEIKLENINFETGIAILYDTKTAESAEVAIGKSTLEVIEKHCKKYGIAEGELLRNMSGRPFGIRHFMKIVQETLPINFHAFRKYCATTIANSENGNIHIAQRQLRHASLTTVMRYVAPSLSENKRLLNNLF